MSEAMGAGLVEHTHSYCAGAADQIYRELFEASSLGIVVVDQDGRILLVNSALVSMFGYAREELVGQPLELLLPESLRDQHTAHRAAFGALPHTRPMGYGLEVVGLRKDGGTFAIEASLGHLHLDGQVAVVAFVADVSIR